MMARILVIGLGSIGMRHLRIARQLLPSADIRGLRHQPGGDLPAEADGLFFELKQAIAFRPNMAVICNPATMHAGVSIPLAEAGVHLIVEKPLSASIADAKALIHAAQDHKITLLAAYNLRFHESLQQFRILLHENTIGRILSVRCEVGQYLPLWRPGTDYRLGVSARKDLGGGALLELSHEIDYIRWIFGEVDWVSAVLSRQSSLDIDTEDTAHLILGFSPDRTGHRLIATLNMDFVRQDACRLCTAIGERGSLRWNGITGTVERFNSEKADWRTVFSHPQHRDESYLAEWRHFLDCVNHSKNTSVSGEDGLKVLQIVDAARRASESFKQARVYQQEE